MLSSTVRRMTQKGVALVVVLLILVVLVILAGTAAVLGTSTQTLSIKAQQESVVLHAADGGLQELMDKINQDIAYGTSGSPTTLARQVNAGGAYSLSMPGRDMAQTDYWWTFTEGAEPYSTNNLRGNASITRPDGLVVPTQCLLAIVSGYDKGVIAYDNARASGQEPRPLRIAAMVTDRWDDGIAADSTINLKNSVVQDTHPGLGAKVRSNQPNPLPKGDKYAVQVGHVTGDVYCCLDPKTIQPDPPGPTWENHPFSPPVDLPNIPIDTIVANAATSATYKFLSDVNGDWSGGKLVIGDKKSGQTTINAPADVYINGSFTYSGAKVLPPGLRLYVNGDVTINGGAASGPTPSSFSYIFSTGTINFNGATTVHTNFLSTNGIRINGNSNLDGFLYARQGDINVTGGGNGSISGVMIARDPDRSDANVLGKVDTSNYSVFTNLDYLTEFRNQFPGTWRRLYPIAWWRLQ